MVLSRLSIQPRFVPLLGAAAVLLAAQAGSLLAQLPPDAVDLAKVNIPETLESVHIDPVTLEPSAADGATWEYEKVKYRGAAADSKERFMAKPAEHAARAEKHRWMENFKLAMSTIWCPITDEVTPGGRMQVEGHGYNWESCCAFCDEEMAPENFEEALERLIERAEEAYELSGGVYVNDASSPVEGAIKDDF